MADPRVAYHAKDIILKHIAATLGDDFLGRFGFQFARIVRQLPADLPVIEVRAQYPDILLLLADGTILHIELQSRFSPDDLLRFADYSWAAYRQYKTRVITIILYGPEVTKIPVSRLDAGAHVVTMTSILLGQEDGAAVTTRLVAKVAAGEALDGADRVDLALAVLMRHGRPLAEVVRELAPVVEALPASERSAMLGSIIGLSYYYLQEDDARAILEALQMANVLEKLVEEGILQGIAQGEARGEARGREEGRVEGRAEAVRALVALKFGVLPPALDARIAGADLAALDRLLARAVTATRIEDL